MKYDKNRFMNDFVWGGALVSVALWLASVCGPVIGGIFAGLPIRLFATIALGGRREGAEFVEKMARGALLGFVANFSFMMTLIFTLKSFGVFYAFLVASLVCIVVIGIIRNLKRQDV